MTDNEIVKALGCCKLTNEQQESQCEDCPLWETSLMICQELLAFHALDLINRQKAEIERLIEQNSRLNKECDHYIDFASTAKSEAIKEFAESVKRNRDRIFNTVYSDYHFSEMIDNLVKEMKENN